MSVTSRAYPHRPGSEAPHGTKAAPPARPLLRRSESTAAGHHYDPAMDVGDDLISRAEGGEAVHVADGLLLVSAERFDTLEGELALHRFEAERAAGGRRSGTPQAEVRRRLAV